MTWALAVLGQNVKFLSIVRAKKKVFFSSENIFLFVDGDFNRFRLGIIEYVFDKNLMQVLGNVNNR